MLERTLEGPVKMMLRSVRIKRPSGPLWIVSADRLLARLP